MLCASRSAVKAYDSASHAIDSTSMALPMTRSLGIARLQRNDHIDVLRQPRFSIHDRSTPPRHHPLDATGSERRSE